MTDPCHGDGGPGRGALLAMLLCLHATSGALAQRAYCNLVDVEVQRLSNAVVLRFVTDGSVQAYADWGEFLDFENDDEARPIKRVPFEIGNAKLRVSSFVNVGVYPVSHVEVLPSRWAREGIGLEVAIVLYTPGRFSGLQLWGPDSGWNWVEDEGIARRGVTYDLRKAKTAKGEDVVAVITSDRRVAQVPDAKREKRLARGPARLRVAGTAASVDVHALNVELRQLLWAISARTGVRFALDGQVQRAVSLNISNVSADEFLSALAMAYGLSLEVKDDLYLLADAAHDQRTAYDRGQLGVVPLRYMHPEDAVQLLPDSILPYARVDEVHNALSVAGPSWLVEKVGRDIALLDTPPELVELELLAVEMRRADLEEVVFGTTYRTAASAWDLEPETGDLSFESVGQLGRDYDLRLQALERSGKGQTRACVKETVVSGREVRLFAGQAKYITVFREGGWGADMTGEALPVEVGADLRAQPVTSGEGPVRVSLHGKVSNIVGEDPVTRLPEISTREIRTTVRISDGDTIVLAWSGLEQADDARRWPGVLGQLPVAETLFRARREEGGDRELFLFLTARIVTSRGEVQTDLKAAEGTRS